MTRCLCPLLLATALALTGAHHAVAQGFGDQGFGDESPPPRPVLLSVETAKLLRAPVTLPEPILLERSPGDAEILKKLEAKCDVSLDNVPLEKALRSLAEEWKLPLRIDEQSLALDGIELDEPVSLTIRGVPRRSALQLLLEALGVMGVVRHDVLLITTEIAADEILETRVYDVADLVLRRDEQGLLRRDFEQISGMFWPMTIAFEDWHSDEIEESATAIGTHDVNAFVVRTAHRDHALIASVFAQLRQLHHDRLPPAVSSRVRWREAWPVAVGAFPRTDPAVDKLLRGPFEPPVPKLTPIPKRERSIRAALDREIAVSFDKTPLDQAVQQIGRKLGLPVYLHRTALSEDGITTTEPITLTLGPLPATAVLKHMLSPLGCTRMIELDVLMVTTAVHAEMFYKARVYDVADLVVRRDAKGRLRRDFGTLIDLIQANTSDPWRLVDSNMSEITEFETPRINALVVWTTIAVHEEITELLVQLRDQGRDDLLWAKPIRRVNWDSGYAYRQKLGVGSESAQPVNPDDPPQGTGHLTPIVVPVATPTAIPEDERRILAMLDESVDVNFRRRPLKQVVAFLGKTLPVGVVLDETALAKAKISSDTPVTSSAAGLSIRSVLGIVLEPLKLNWTIHEGGLLLTTDAGSESRHSVRVYDVPDLVLARDANGRPTRSFGSLMETLRRGTGGLWEPKPESKKAQASSQNTRRTTGRGTLAPLETPRINAIVVRQCPRTHWEIADVLAQLRAVRHKDLPPALDVEDIDRYGSGNFFNSGSNDAPTGNTDDE